jgi:predicted esterase
MLDLIISYINFLILSVAYIVKKFVFRPPKPPKYKIIKQTINNKGKIEEKENIFFLMESKENNLYYKQLRPKKLNIEYFKIIKDDNYLPILKITPINCFPYCMIYCQGNSGDLGTSLFECNEISIKCHCVIVAFEYPGYGICKNDEITETEFFKRIKIVYNYIITELKYKPNKIFVYGFSMGSGIAFDFACKKEYPFAGLIIQSPFLSIVRTMYNFKKTKYFDLFNNCDKAKHLCRKTLILHGNKDKIVPYIHGRILSKLIPKKYFYDFITVLNADHNNLLKTDETIFKYINEFIYHCIRNNNSTDYYEINKNTQINFDGNDDVNEISYTNNFMKSEAMKFNENDEKKNNRILSKDKEGLSIKLKSNSCINYPLIHAKKIKSIIDNDINIIKDGNSNINPNYDSHYNNLRFSYEKEKYKYKQNINQRKTIYSPNYYCVDIGTYSKNNKFALYKKYFKNVNNINNNNISNNNSNNNIQKSKFENSLVSINSSTNNINSIN